jgi:hypothetical protein
MDKLFKIFGKSKKNEKNTDVRSLSVVNSLYENSSNENDKISSNTSENLLKINPDKVDNIKDTGKISQPDNNLKLTGNSSSSNENTNEIVLVNTPDTIQRSKLEGFYYKKYINKIQNLSISNPILIERERMKISFDSEVMEYLINDMTLIFREKQSVIDTNQVNF